MHAEQPDQVENEFRNIKLKLKGPNRHSELQAVKALMAMSAQHSIHNPFRLNEVNSNINSNYDKSSHDPVVNYSSIVEDTNDSAGLLRNTGQSERANKRSRPGNLNGHRNNDTTCRVGKDNHEKPVDLSRSESPEPIYGLAITMTEEEFKQLAEREGIEDVIGEPICKLCGGLFSGPLGIALHMCPAMKRQTYRCEICGEDKWKTKANLHSHIKWCKKRLCIKTEQHESKQVY